MGYTLVPEELVKKIFLAVVFTTLTALNLFPENLRHIPYNDPVYPFLDKAYAMGWINYLPQMRPYTEGQVLEYLIRIEDTAGLAELSRFQDRIRDFRRRFQQEQWTLPIIRFGNSGVDLDFPVTLEGSTRLNNLSDTFLGSSQSIVVQASFADLLYLGLNTRYDESLATWEQAPFRKFFFPQREELAAYHFFLSRGESGFAHLDQLQVLHEPGEIDLFLRMNSISQNTVDLGLGLFTVGREALSWGPSSLANLSLSATSKPYDYLMVQVPFAEKGNFTWFTGILQDFWGPGLKDNMNKLLSMKRVEFQMFDFFLFAIYEAVIYSMRFELAYLNPLSIYGVSEVRLGDYDNKLVGFDLVFRFPHVKSYLSFYVDDWDLGAPLNFNYYHNEWAAILGLQLFELLPNLAVNLEYIRLSHWMYTHRDDLIETDNFNRYMHFGSHLGHFLNPNSHMIYLELNYDLSADFNLGTSFWFTQNGGGGYGDVDGDGDPGNDGEYDRGDIETPPFWTFEATLPGWPDNQFLDGIVENNIDWTIFADLRIPRSRIQVKASYSLEYTWNLDKVVGSERWDHILSISAGWTTF